MADQNNVVPFPRRRRAQRCSKPMTIDIASKAKTMVIQLGMAQHEAAAKLGVNPGRVCEVVNGYKFRDAPFAPIADVI
ncbi:MAG: hypothetical protein FD139_747 [Methylocystaceae bacterium]|nr:MAG: hypothetical protein FD148_64 [Methylocystaceae bacterium]KAF0213997.1 MAG: hypothetical protein FD172_121 [Methylocystaceae bacterium]TXT46902.1 MAG: hypothetical protein FD139_747 [Methylocystaceae bacterium]